MFVQVTTERRIWGSNNLVPGVTEGGPPWHPVGQRLQLTEFPSISNNNVSYQRQFWTYQGMHFISDFPASIPASHMYPPNFTATCWYSSSSDEEVEVPKGAYTNAFSIRDNRFLNEYPVESVSPADTKWSPPETFVPSDKSRVEITAKVTMHNEYFRHWFVPGRGVLNTQVLTVQQNETIWPVAIYGPLEKEENHWSHLHELLRRKLRELLESQRFDELLGGQPQPGGPRVDPIPPDFGRKYGYPSSMDPAWIHSLMEVAKYTYQSTDVGERELKELEAIVRNPASTDRVRLKQGLVDIQSKIGRLDILRKNIEDALGKIK